MAIKKIAVIKFGGEVAESSADLDNLAYSLKKLTSSFKIVLVHGGGPYATKLSEKLGLETKMVGGRRVTCSETIEVMKMSLPGVISSNVLAKLYSHQISVTPVSGIGTCTVNIRPPKKVSGSNEVVDFGLVGDIIDINTTLIHHLIDGNFIPLVSPLSATDDGMILNINADSVASKIALALKADVFVSITKVGGIYKDLQNPASKISCITVTEAKDFISQGVIVGGMIPKVEESFVLLENGLKEFHIVGLQKCDDLLNELVQRGSCGSCLIA